MIYQQVPIRLKLALVSSPPITPLDSNTGQTPKFWRSQSIGVAVGLFDAYGAPIDLSNLVRLDFYLQRDASDLVPLVSKTLLPNNANWRNVITTQEWDTGINQNALFSLTAADTDQSLGGETEATYWCIVRGETSGGVPITYAAGPLVIYNASSALPIGPTNYVSRHEQTNSADNSTITPTSQQHTEVLTVDGAARTSEVILGNSGMVAGATLTVLVNMTSTAGVLIRFHSVLVGNPVLMQFSSDAGVARGLFVFSFDGANWTPLYATIPAY